MPSPQPPSGDRILEKRQEKTQEVKPSSRSTDPESLLSKKKVGRTPENRHNNKGSGDPSTQRSRSELTSNSNKRSSNAAWNKQEPQNQLKELEERLEREKKEVAELKERQRIVDEKIREAKEALSKIPDDVDSQLEETTRRLTVAESFLLSADMVPEAEIVRMVEVINDEILQLTSIVADMIQVAQIHSLEDKVIADFVPLAQETLGKDFLDIVMHKQLQDSSVIQIGWQGILVHLCLDLVKRWSIGSQEWLNDKLQHVYNMIYENNVQAVAARWRAITFRALRKVSPPDIESWIKRTTRYLLAFPIVCGYISGKEEYESISNAFRQRMRPLVDKCLELNCAIFEGVISSDIRPCAYNIRSLYYPNMADLDYEEEEESRTVGEKQIGERIACSLTLGLDWTRKMKGTGKIEGEVLVKAKVILLNTIKSMIS